MRARLRNLTFALAMLVGGQAVAQQSLFQAGPMTPGHSPRYTGAPGATQPVVTDAGGAGGGPIGSNLTEIGITSQSPTATYPVASGGNGPNGEHGCFYDAPTDNSGGYHYLCLDANAQGGGLLSFGALGGASVIPLQILDNGTLVNLSTGLAGLTIGVSPITGGSAGQILQVGAGGATLAASNSGTGVLAALGVNIGTAGAFVVNGGVLGTPSSGNLANATGYPVASLTNLGTGVSTALGANVGSAGAVVVNSGALGTPSSGTLTHGTGLPISTGVSGLGTGIATALSVNTGSAGAPVLYGGAAGQPSAIDLTNGTLCAISTCVSGLGTGVATSLATAPATAADVQAGTSSSKIVTPSALSGSQAFQTLTYGTTTVWNMANGYNASVTLTGVINTLTIQNPVVGQTYTLLVVQGGGGSQTVTWPGSIDWGAAGTPTLTTTNGKHDTVTMICTGAGPTFDATIAKGF